MSVEVGSGTRRVVRIYVRLLGEGTDVFRPTLAEVLPGGRFKIVATGDYDAQDEAWEFVPGAIVRCQQWIFADGGEGLVAIRKA